jgi:hypothetical protein
VHELDLGVVWEPREGAGPGRCPLVARLGQRERKRERSARSLQDFASGAFLSKHTQMNKVL